MAEKQSIKRFIVRDPHGHIEQEDSFSVVGEVHVDIVPGYGEPYAESEYINGTLTITIHNIEGNGITEITTNSQEGDEAVNTVTIKTNANPEGVVLEVRNGSRGNGIASSSEVLSPEDGGTNTHTITDTDGNEHVFHTKNGRKGDKGDQGDSAIWTGEGEPWSGLKNTTGQSTTEPMSQKAVTDELTKIDEYSAGKIGELVSVDLSSKIKWTNNYYINYNNGNMLPSSGGQSATDYIDISGGKVVSFVGNLVKSPNVQDPGASFYDSTKTFISSIRYDNDNTIEETTIKTYTADIPANAKYIRFTLLGTLKSYAAIYIYRPYTVEDAIDDKISETIPVADLDLMEKVVGVEHSVTIPMMFGKLMHGQTMQGTASERWNTSFSKLIENKGNVTSIPSDNNVRCCCFDENFNFLEMTSDLATINAAKYIRFVQDDPSQMAATDIRISYKGILEYISEPRIYNDSFSFVGKGNVGLSKDLFVKAGDTYLLSWDSTWTAPSGAVKLLEISYYDGSFHVITQKQTIDVTEYSFTVPNGAQFVQIWAKIPSGTEIQFTIENETSGILVFPQWFSVDVALPLDNPITDFDDIERLYTNAYISLPYNYRQRGEKNKLVVYGTGTSGAKWSTFAGNHELMAYLNAMGYAVLVVNACSDKYKSSRRNNCATPLGVACFVEAVKYAIENYNMDEHIYIFGKSAGGMTAMNLVNSSGLHIKAAAIACPNLDVWNDYRCTTLSNGAQTGYLGQYNVTEYTSWTAEAIAEMKTKQDEFDGYNPMTFKCTIDKKAYNDYILDNDYPLSSGAYPNPIMKNYSNTYLMSETMQNLVKDAKLFLNAPVKIWYTEDDPQVPYGTIVNFAKMASNAGCVCKLRKFPDGSGGHYCADAMASLSSAGADLAPRVTVQTRYGGEINIPLGIAEVLQWIELY